MLHGVFQKARQVLHTKLASPEERTRGKIILSAAKIVNRMPFGGTGAGESKRSKSSSFEDLAKRVQVPVQIADSSFQMPF